MTRNQTKNKVYLFPPGMRKSKRLMDLLLVVGTFPLWGLCWLLAAAIVLIWLGRPLYFRQQRQGYQGKPFQMVKFRSMSDAREADGSLKPDLERMGKAGLFLRSFSLDEIPQLGLVLKGEMSLVGPRPLPLLYDDRYDATQRRRFEVYPGITGYAQVNGRNRVDWEERFRLDVEYVERNSLWGDLKILLLTVAQTVFRIHTSGSEDTVSKPFEPKGRL